MGRSVILHSKPTINSDDIASVTKVLQSNHLEDGEVVKELEKYIAGYFNKKYAVTVSTGFAAIHLSLIALGIKENDEIIIPSYSCSALLNPVKLLRGKPVIVDVNKNSFNISLSEVKMHLTKKTKAIIVPHIFGFPAQVDELSLLKIPIIEDCAQSLGGKYKGYPLGTLSDLGIYSFYASKMICAGDGGMVITNNPEYNETIRNYRYYGHKRMHSYVAYNYHLTNLPSALALSQFKKIDSFITRRKKIADIYDSAFKSETGIFIDFENKNDSCYYRYPVRLNMDIEYVKTKMAEKGIQCGYGVLEGLHQLSRINNKRFPNTEHNLKTILSLPIYPSLTEDEAKYIAESLINIIKSS
jgi:perosamine synthetase